MNISIIIQARMGSSRLPGKVLKYVNGITLLECLLQQVSFCKSIDGIIVATTTKKIDDQVYNKCKELNVSVFRGDDLDVLNRYYQCAKTHSIKNIIRITADNPFVDPQIIDEVVESYKKNRSDYVSNCEKRTFPYGTEVEIFSFDTLERAFDEAKNNHEREHVTPYMRNKKKFKTFCLESVTDHSHLRLSVDRNEDLIFIQEIYKRIIKKPILLENILEIIKKEPNLLAINTNIPK